MNREKSIWKATVRQKESLGNMLDGFHTFDALSSYEFYRHGLIDKPIPGNNEIEEFLEHGLTDMWTYYCTGQFYEVSKPIHVYAVRKKQNIWSPAL